MRRKEKLLFFRENISCLIIDRSSVENQVATDLYSTRVRSHYLLCSKLVGIVTKSADEKIILNEGDPLCKIAILGVEYEITMDRTGYVRKKYVLDNGIVEYGRPLFLIKYLK